MENSYEAPISLLGAKELFDQGYEAQKNGQFADAIDFYKRSIKSHPSAEAYTFMGWTYSFLGEYPKAINACLKAIEVDPDFGNPYNDIGAYLIELGKIAEALPWLKRAIRAPRYDCTHYPWYNLGKVHERVGSLEKARDCYARALRAYAGYPLAEKALIRVLVRLN
jgi:Tfp pilus assembly protein PilF